MVDFPCEIPLCQVGAADVLFCRGKSVHNHKGNVVYRAMIRKRASKYQSQESTTFDRDIIAREVLQRVHESNGRFLCPSQENQSAAWVECPHRIARIKVKQSLRDMKISGGLKKLNSNSKQTAKKEKVSKSLAKKEEVYEPEATKMRLVPGVNSFDPTWIMRNSNCTFLMQNPEMICEEREKEGISSDKNTGRGVWEDVQELCRERTFAMPPVSYGAQNWFRSLPQASTHQDGQTAVPSFQKSIRLASSELALASLRISYMELLRGQTSSRSSLDSETIEILRRIRDS